MVRVDDVSSTETNGWTAGVNVLPEVVGHGDVQLAGIFGGVGVGVADEGGLPVVVDEGVGECDVVSSVGHIEESIVVVLVVVTVGGEINVINPDIGGFLCDEC